MKTKQLLISILCGVFISNAFAGMSVSESSTEKLKTYKEEGETYYSIEKTGKFSVTAKISGDTFYQAGIYAEDINENSTIEISLGDFSFSSTLGEADKHSLTTTKLSANWSLKEETCNSSDICKEIKTTKISLNTSGGNVILKVDGTNKASDNESYGLNVLSDICSNNGNGQIEQLATLTVDGIPLTENLPVKCSVKTKKVSKSGEDFELNTIKVSAKVK